MLEIKNLHVTVDNREILRGIDLSLNEGEVHAIMGPNGSGKSTLAYVLAGKADYEVTEGEVLFNGENVLAMDPDERAARGRQRHQPRAVVLGLFAEVARAHHLQVPELHHEPGDQQHDQRLQQREARLHQAEVLVDPQRRPPFALTPAPSRGAGPRGRTAARPRAR